MTEPTKKQIPEIPDGTTPEGVDKFNPLAGLVAEEHDPPEVAQAKAAVRATTRADKEAALANLSEEAAATRVPGDLAAGAEANALLQAQIDSLRQELAGIRAAGADKIAEGEKGSPGGYPWMYWRLPSNWQDETRRNWVTYGQGGLSPAGHRDPGAYSMSLEAGMIPLNKYGIIEPPKDPKGWLNFIPLIQRGGAIEFPASQVIEWKWHVRPPLPGVLFPQYEMVKQDVKPVTCEACGFRLYFMKDNNQAGNFYRGHLMQAHEYPFREAAEAVRRQGLSVVAFYAEDRSFEETAAAKA